MPGYRDIALLAKSLSRRRESPSIRKIFIAILAMLLSSVAAPASAQIAFTGGLFQTYFYVAPPGPVTRDNPLQTGANSYSDFGYNITCFEDECDGLPFGGTIGDFTYSAAVTQTGLAWTLSGFQGSDSGDLTEAEWYIEAFFASPDEFTFTALNTPSVIANCSVCSRSLTQDAGVYFDGSQWIGYVTVFGQASLRMGSQTLAQTYTVDFRPLAGGVPEPGAWALLITGFGLIGSTLRARAKPRRAMAFC